MAFSPVLIITNNPIVKNNFDAEIYFVSGHQRHVLYQVLNKVAAGHGLLSHPLAGSIKPEDNPYRSVVLTATASAEVDGTALNMLEHCLEKVERAVANEHIDRYWHEDYQLIDKELLDNALQSLK